MARTPTTPSDKDSIVAGELRDGFKFRSGRLSLDLPASLAARLREEPRDLLAVACARGKAFSAKDRALLNRWAAEPPPAPQLGPSGLTWTRSGVRSMLAAVARDGVELFGGPLAQRIRECAGEGCALLFVD